jgi:hypothetical protein
VNLEKNMEWGCIIYTIELFLIYGSIIVRGYKNVYGQQNKFNSEVTNTHLIGVEYNSIQRASQCSRFLVKRI